MLFLYSLSVIFIRILYFLLYCIVCVLYFWSGHTTRSFLVSSFTCGPISQDGLAQFVRRPEWSSIFLLHRFLFETNKRENITRTDPCHSLVFIEWFLLWDVDVKNIFLNRQKWSIMKIRIKRYKRWNWTAMKYDFFITCKRGIFWLFHNYWSPHIAVRVFLMLNDWHCW